MIIIIAVFNFWYRHFWNVIIVVITGVRHHVMEPLLHQTLHHVTGPVLRHTLTIPKGVTVVSVPFLSPNCLSIPCESPRWRLITMKRSA